MGVYDSRNTDWTSYPIVITGSTSNPTKGGTTTVDRAMWRRVGNVMEITYNYRQNAAGSNGSGAYYFSIPSGYTIDLNKKTYGTTFSGSMQGVSGTFQATGGGADPLLIGTAQATTSTTFGAYYGTDAVATTNWGSASSATFGDTNLEFSFFVAIPIVNWS
jgi:hypothetical protein